uniref:Transthyretin-like family protein n=1 Tax=Heterorhabditis bacteriophora TaxID=37862 RepID=A0A1I7XS97_HETBA
MLKFLLICVLLGVTSLSVLARVQKISVKGTAICNKKRLANVKVILKEKDTVTLDDVLATVSTDSEGDFEISGEDSEVFSIEPYIVFEHDCNIKQQGCVRSTEFEIPKKYIDGTYDMTYVTLDIIQYKDSQKC